MERVIVALRTFVTLALPYFRSEDRWRARLLLAGVIGAELGLVYVAVTVIQWNARFFNALEARDWNGFTALAYAGIGTLVAHLIGWRLIPLQSSQQRYESDFRFAIARVTDNAEPVALMGGEAVERAELRTRFWRLVRNWTALVQRQTRLIGFTAGYGHISTVFPILVVSPAYLTGPITLGALIQAHLAV